MAALYVSVVMDRYDIAGNLVAKGTASWTPSLEIPDPADEMLIGQGPVTVAFGTALKSARLVSTDSVGPQSGKWTQGVTYEDVPGNPAAASYLIPAGPAAFTATNASPCVITWAATASLTVLPNGTGVQLSGSPPAGFAAGTTYFVVNGSGQTFQLAATQGGPAIGSTSAGSGNLTVVQYNLSALAQVPAGISSATSFPAPSGTPAARNLPFATGSGEASAWDVIKGSDLPGTAVTPGSYTSTNLTVDATGRITGASNGSGGGFVNPMTTLGDLIYEDATPAAARLAGNTAATRKFLRQLGTGSASAAPAWDTLQAGDLPSNGGIPLAYLPSVAITTTGATFSPSVTLAAGSTATVSWVYNGAVVATGLTPVISFGSSGTRTVRMFAADASGYNALSQVTVFNIGYNSSNDSSPYSPSSAYNWTPQAVSGLSGVNQMTGLVYLLAENVTGLAGTVDCSGMAQLTNLELYGSAVQQVNISGCGSLVRLDVELNAVSALNLGLIAASMADLRAAAQQGGYLQLAPLPGSLPSQYHFCTRDQLVYGMPNFATAFPQINQLWTWNTGQYGVLAVNSTSLTSLQAYQNWYVSAHLANQFPLGRGGYVDLHSNQLTSIDLSGRNSGITYLDLSQNPMVQATVDSILATVDGWGTSNGTLNLGSTAAPSAGGTAHVTALRGRGWTVTVDASGSHGAGAKWTYGENVQIICPPGYGTPQQEIVLSAPVNAGDLVVVAVTALSTPTVVDTSGNTWTVTASLSGQYIAYCLSAAASSGGLTAWVSASGGIGGVAIGRYTPTGVVTFGGAAGANGSAGGLNAGSSINLGDLGTVPAHALAWGAFFNNSTGNQGFNPGFQTGSSGTPDVFGFKVPGPSLNGTGIVCYVLDCANTDAAMTWYGSGTGGFGGMVSAYFTST